MGDWSCSCGYCDKAIIILCDDVGPFLRQFVNTTSGKVIVLDTELDGSTLYTPVGTVGLCDQSSTPPVEVNVTPILSSSTGVGSTTAGRQSVSIANVGIAAGIVGGVSIAPGAVVSYNAYHDPVSNEFKRLAAIAYDATGTTFLISETP